MMPLYRSRLRALTFTQNDLPPVPGQAQNPNAHYSQQTTTVVLPTPSLRIWIKVSLEKTTIPNPISGQVGSSPRLTAELLNNPLLLRLSTSLGKGNERSLTPLLGRAESTEAKRKGSFIPTCR